jgi:hypothetical protein
MLRPTVKARFRQGAKSFDITIPVKVVKEEDIKDEDIFLVDVSEIKNG